MFIQYRHKAPWVQLHFYNRTRAEFGSPGILRFCFIVSKLTIHFYFPFIEVIDE